MKYSKVLSVCLLITYLGGSAAFSQRNGDVYLSTSAGPSGSYLGQIRPGLIPEKFGPDFISSAEGDEYSICTSPDGNEIYFSRSTPNVSNTIWWSHQENNIWTTPVPALFTGQFYNSEPFITYDNQKMYFVSEREGQGVFQLWYVNRSGSGWTTPQKLGSPFPNKSKMFPNAAANGNLYFSQLDDDNRSYFYMARNNNGAFETPVKLSSAVNAFYFHVHAFIAPDESYLVFDAVPTQQSTGSSIFVSFKKPDNTWGSAVKLNSTINSTDNQYCPYITPDGQYLFFTKQGDLWWVDAKVVMDLKPADVDDEHELMPQGFRLYQNSPNPFNPSTVLSYELPVASSVKLVIYDMLGRTVSILVDNVMTSSKNQVTWNAATFPSGVYLYSLQAGNFMQTRKMILTK